ncbi:MAG: HAD hydrolase-like protein, partial [Candidatus Omnitrophica bacterium]|nr:HAD hydrolase-like protein [Candidatus Omnitrophota bacterium]
GEALYVGDMHIDAQAGLRAGIKTVMVTTGSSTRGQIEKEGPYMIIKRLSGLLKIL